MADMKSLEELIEELQKPEYYRAYKKRDELIEQIRTTALELRKSQLVCVGKKIIRRLYLRVKHKRIAYTSFHKLIEILRIYDAPELYYYLHDIVLADVRENKYESFWFLVTLLKIKHRIDGDTERLQEIYIERYLLPNQNSRIDSKFLSTFVTEFPTYDRSKLFRHCIRYRQYHDTFGDGLLKIFLGLNPEYKKFLLLE